MKYVVEFSALDFDSNALNIDFKNHQIENPIVQVSRLIDEFVYQVEPCKIYISKAHNINISVKEPFHGRMVIL
ncbi:MULTISPECIES: hypothetical protein [Myroides]|uniref:Uncharacterized protein n=1 Tax=Myroides albus TaxID=2562892 RepID=A0A6I3LJM7_9FLAO|nr:MULTISPECIES: hypothetical protein [Myroides]MTG96681.1 hypothetical protein [Myroides albus]MVX34693.1 hypothetical protein [Myroides sp. LoEW2-1]UVD80907.1 hypothetical protein NWE55_06590 [Myroides albus]